jgi:hypothetical protein
VFLLKLPKRGKNEGKGREGDTVVYKEAAAMSYITICIMTEHEGKPLGFNHDGGGLRNGGETTGYNRHNYERRDASPEIKQPTQRDQHINLFHPVFRDAARVEKGCF